MTKSLAYEIRERPPSDEIKVYFQKAARFAAWTLMLAIIVLSIVPADLRPETVAPHDLEHFIIYLTTGAAFGLGYDFKRSVLTPMLVIFCGAIEIAQLFFPTRHARLTDFLVDALAICVGLMIATVVAGHIRARI